MSLLSHNNDNIRISFMHGHAKKLSGNDPVEGLYLFMPRKIKLDEIVRDTIPLSES